jgi:hypothetical protein
MPAKPPRRTTRQALSRPKRIGRPPKIEFNLQLQERICRKIERGLPFTPSAQAVGLPAGTFELWRVKRPGFEVALRRSEAKVMHALVGMIFDAARGKLNYHAPWQSAAWMLERRWPQFWGRLDRHLIHAETNDRSPTAPELIQAICRALGVVGDLQPIRRQEVPVGLLPSGNGQGDAMQLEALPQE